MHYACILCLYYERKQKKKMTSKEQIAFDKKWNRRIKGIENQNLDLDEATHWMVELIKEDIRQKDEGKGIDIPSLAGAKGIVEACIELDQWELAKAGEETHELRVSAYFPSKNDRRMVKWILVK